MVTSKANWLLAVLLIGLTLLTNGCGYPEVQPENMELITSLRTACSAKDATWLTANVEKMDAAKSAGEMSEEEHATFMAIVEQARRGDWEGAERTCLKFQKAQGPTPEQMEKMRVPRGVIPPRPGTTKNPAGKAAGCHAMVASTTESSA